MGVLGPKTPKGVRQTRCKGGPGPPLQQVFQNRGGCCKGGPRPQTPNGVRQTCCKGAPYNKFSKTGVRARTPLTTSTTTTSLQNPPPRSALQPHPDTSECPERSRVSGKHITFLTLSSVLGGFCKLVVVVLIVRGGVRDPPYNEFAGHAWVFWGPGPPLQRLL